MTKNKLKAELESKVIVFDLMLNNLKENLAEARRESLNKDFLLNEKAIIDAKRQMTIQFLADLECID